MSLEEQLTEEELNGVIQIINKWGEIGRDPELLNKLYSILKENPQKGDLTIGKWVTQKLREIYPEQERSTWI
jgi:hypothetical protein